jgi:hypothetical protein
VYKAVMFIAVAAICALWTSTLHVSGMQDCVPGSLMGIGTLVFCMSCGKHETFLWNWVFGPLGQTLGGGMAIAGFATAFLVNAW